MEKIHAGKNAKAENSSIGGKAKGLIFLAEHNFRIPTFYLLNFETLSAVAEGKTDFSILLDNWKKEFKIQTGSLWAVRSSVDLEDGNEQSFAGFFKTVTNLQIDQLEKAIITVLGSYTLLKEQNYTPQKKTEYGIIIQEMIRSEYSGVIFSHDPANVRDSSMHIHVIPGMGENLVSGKEDAFRIVYSKNSFQYKDLEKSFKGEIYAQHLRALEKTGKALKEETKHALKELVKGTKKIYDLKQVPVDIEFTIAGGVLYWLQVRPITTGKHEPFIWDNTSSESNYSGITLPLSISFATHSIYLAYNRMALFLRMPEQILQKNQELLHTMAGEINGRLYYNVSAWQKLIYQLPFGKKIANALPGIWGMKPAVFTPEKYGTNALIKLKLLARLIFSLFFFKSKRNAYNKNYKEISNLYASYDLTSQGHAELIRHCMNVERVLAGNAEVPMMNGFFTVLFFSLLKKMLKGSRLSSRYPNFINDILFSQNDVISVVIIREFQNLISQIHSSRLLRELFSHTDAAEILKQLSVKFPEFYKAVNTYVSMYGERSEEGELKMETVNYKEDPTLFILFLKSCLGSESDTQRTRINFNYKAALSEVYGNNIFKKAVFKVLIRQTIKRVRDRENFRFMRTGSFGLMRHIFRAMDERLLKEGMISEKRDSLYLLVNELKDIDLRESYKNIIRTRKEAYKVYEKTIVHTRYIQTGDRLTPDDSIELYNSNKIIKGIGCSSGVVKGKIKIIDNTTESESCSGKILIANYFEPGKLNLFSKAAGLISVRGNLLSHTAILCREMGIPAIVSVKGLMHSVKDGDIIEMDGATGIIKLSV